MAARYNVWAIVLDIDDKCRLEQRVLAIVRYVAGEVESVVWRVTDMDATGTLGGRITSDINEYKTISLSTNEFIELLASDGQVIEMDVAMVEGGRERLRIVVRDGSSVDVLGIGARPEKAVLGCHRDVESALFQWAPK